MGKRVLTWGWFGFHNLGDDLILYTFIENIKTKCPDISLSVAMHEKYDIDKSIMQVDRSYKTLFSADKYNTLVIGPGGIFPDNKTTKLLLYLMVLIYWKSRHNQVLFFGVGISDKMSKLQRLLWRRMVKLSDVFMPRSETVMTAIGLQSTSLKHSMPDSVFAMRIPKEESISEEQRIGIAVANLTGNDFDSADYQRQITIWSDVITSCIDLGKEVDLIAFTQDNDDVLIDALKKKHKKVRCIHYSEIGKALEYWSEYEAVIAMRFHSVVLSIVSGTPFVPIAYGHKTVNLTNMVGMGDYLLKWSLKNGYFKDQNILNASDIIDSFTRILTEKEIIASKLQKAITTLRQSADDAYSEFCAYLMNSR